MTVKLLPVPRCSAYLAESLCICRALGSVSRALDNHDYRRDFLARHVESDLLALLVLVIA